MKPLLALFLFISISMVSVGCAAHNRPAAIKEVAWGLKQGRNHDWAKALKHFEKAIALDPSYSDAWANHGTAHLNLGRPKKAVESYLRASKLDPKDPYVYCSLCSAKLKMGELNEALQHANKAIEVDPKFAPAIANKGKVLRKLNRHEEAEQLFKKAFTLDPNLKKHFSESETPADP